MSQLQNIIHAGRIFNPVGKRIGMQLVFMQQHLDIRAQVVGFDGVDNVWLVELDLKTAAPAYVVVEEDAFLHMEGSLPVGSIGYKSGDFTSEQ